MHEIITLQLGQRSNYVATHFWNLQESYFTYGENEEPLVDHDVHFRPGLGADGSETFTPRTIIYDLKGGFGTLRKYNALYEVEEPSGLPRGLWEGNEVVQRQPNVPQNEYQKSLEAGFPAPRLSSASVRYWSDFNRVYYHPRSIVQLNEYELNSSLMPFEEWGMGEDLFRDLDKEHDLLDRDLRPFAEECDHLRALQLFTSSDDAWGGFASRYVDRIRDEYGKTAIWVWALEDGARLPRSQWYTSALIASAVETVTIPSRLRTYRDFEASLMGHRGGSQTIFELQSSVIPLDTVENRSPWATSEHSTHESADEAKLNFDLNFTVPQPLADDTTVFTQVQVFRGEEQGPNATNTDSLHVEDIGLSRKLRLYASKPAVERFSTNLRFPLPDSYPRDIFRGYDTQAGVELMAALSSTSRIADKLKDLQAIANRGVGVDEREDLTNSIGEIRELYEKDWGSDSDSGDD
ncbi:Protein dml1 [Talaromyces atroroseus]|uniref:Protein DML1 n=1 Tax=Talaromyces atroroseus TaxID=1441469 RepID=A0A225AGD7_TALAT|nr:Protein dml1 [Talaromyces atroroseus]OKL56068.1 Protein dml1 [Talaromyces atroroseus]